MSIVKDCHKKSDTFCWNKERETLGMLNNTSDWLYSWLPVIKYLS